MFKLLSVYSKRVISFLKNLLRLSTVTKIAVDQEAPLHYVTDKNVQTVSNMQISQLTIERCCPVTFAVFEGHRRRKVDNIQPTYMRLYCLNMASD